MLDFGAPGFFHLGWAGLLLVLLAMSGLRRRARPSALFQALIALAVAGWGGSTLVGIAQDRPAGLEVAGYELSPPQELPAITSLGRADVADVHLADPYADDVHLLVRWEDGPELWNASARRRVELDGIELHDVQLVPGTVLDWGGVTASVDAAPGWPGVAWTTDGAARTWRLGPEDAALATAPGIRSRRSAALGWLVRDGDTLVLVDEQPEPEAGPAARVRYSRGSAWLTFASAEDRAEHPITVAVAGESPVRPADRWRPLTDGSVLTLGHSRFRVRLDGDRIRLDGLGPPARWPDEGVIGSAPGVLAAVSPRSVALAAVDPSDSVGFSRVGGVLGLSSGGPASISLRPGEQARIPLTEDASVRLRFAAAGDPLAALAGEAAMLDRSVWRAFVVLALAYLLLAGLLPASGLLHGRSAGVLHGCVILLLIGLACLLRLSDAGDPLRAGWVLRQARLAAVGLSAAAAAAAVLFTSRRPTPGRWFLVLGGPRRDGAPARWLYLGALGGLLLQLPFGEAGIAVPGLGSVQPIEAARTLLVLHLAYWTARALEEKRERLRGREGLATRWRYMGHVLPVLLVLGVCYGLRDISPILVFGVFLAVLYAATWIRPSIQVWPPRAWRDHVLVEALGVAAVLGFAGWLVLGNPDGTVARRIATWWDPWSRGDEAYQAVVALWTTASGGLWGAGWEGANGVLPPAVQDDFVLALLAARGGVASVVLLAATFAVVLISGYASLGARGRVAASRVERERAGILASSVLWMVAIQAAVVLGSATGGLPTMGQPLPFVSGAGSHLLLFCVPAVALVLGCTRVRVVAPVRRPANWGLDRPTLHTITITRSEA